MKRLAGGTDAPTWVDSALDFRLVFHAGWCAVRGFMALSGRIWRFCDANPVSKAVIRSSRPFPLPDLGRFRHPTESCPLEPEHGEAR